MTHAAQIEMFPALPRNTVDRSTRDMYNEYRAKQEEFGGLMPMPLAGLILGVSKQRMHQLVNSGALRHARLTGAVMVSAEDVELRLRQPVASGYDGHQRNRKAA